MDDSGDRYKGFPDFGGSDGPEGKRKTTTSPIDESWDLLKRSPDLAGFDSQDGKDATKTFSRGVKQILELAKAAAVRLIERIHPTPPPNQPNPPKPDMAAFERFVREQLEQKLDVILKRFDGVEKRVDHVVESSVRNESHMKQVNDQYKAFEQSIQDLVKSTKESLSQEMRVLFEAQMMEFKVLNEKSTIEQMDSCLRDIEIAATFPRRILKLCDKAVYCLAVVQFLFTVAFHRQAVPPEVAAKLEVVQPKLDQLAYKLEELPKKCKSVELQKGKFTDLGRTSAELLHSFFHSGPDSGYFLSYSADATSGALALICGDGGPLSVNVPDLASLSFKLKTKATSDLNVVGGTFRFPHLDYYGVFKPSFSVSRPASSASVHYLHEYGGLLASVERGVNPLVSLSCVFGVKAFSLGAELGFNPVNKLWTKCDAGLRCNTSGLDIALLTKNKMDTFSSSVCYRWGESVAVGFENSFTLSTKVHKMFVGLSHSFDPITTLKARLGFEARPGKADDQNDGKLFDKSAVCGLALLRRWGKCAAGFSVEVDLDKKMAPRFGVFLKFGAAKPARHEVASVVE